MGGKTWGTLSLGRVRMKKGAGKKDRSPKGVDVLGVQSIDHTWGRRYRERRDLVNESFLR